MSQTPGSECPGSTSRHNHTEQKYSLRLQAQAQSPEGAWKHHIRPNMSKTDFQPREPTQPSDLSRKALNKVKQYGLSIGLRRGATGRYRHDPRELASHGRRVRNNIIIPLDLQAALPGTQCTRRPSRQNTPAALPCCEWFRGRGGKSSRRWPRSCWGPRRYERPRCCWCRRHIGGPRDTQRLSAARSCESACSGCADGRWRQGPRGYKPVCRLVSGERHAIDASRGRIATGKHPPLTGDARHGLDSVNHRDGLHCRSPAPLRPHGREVALR